MTATAMTRDNDTKDDGSVTNGSLLGFRDRTRMAAVGSGAAKQDDSSFRSISSQGSEDAVSFFGIAVRSNVSLCDDDELPLVFSNRKEALRCARKYKGARFKAFPTRDDAVAFCERFANDIEEEADSATVLVGEKPSAYRNPKSQDVVRLRKMIEAGDAEGFRLCVWSNPRYLVSSGDTPTIMQEGFRYNALHVACMRCQPMLVKLILETIEDPKFLALMYPEDAVTVRLERTVYLVDLYLNTPDKGRCETPLHFACKFGCARSVEILLNHPQCVRTLVNKFGQTAREMICERCASPDGAVKQQMDSYFENRFYVPVIRSEDNSVPPSVGTPFSPDSASSPAFLSPVKSSPRDPSLVVAATVGPISPCEARSVYKTWKTAPGRRLHTTFPSPLEVIRLSDPEKGLERVGRSIAKERNLPWNEFWPFLGTWCNFSTPEGMSKLESHLNKMHVELLCEQRVKDYEASMRTSSSEHSPSLMESEPVSPMSELCQNLRNFHMGSLSCSSGSDSMSSDKVQEVHCPVSSTPTLSRGFPAGALKSASQNMSTETGAGTMGEPWAMTASHVVAQNVVSVLYDAIVSGRDGVALEQAIGSELADQVLTDLGELERSLSSLPHATDVEVFSSPAQFHSHLARLVYNGLRDCAVATELSQLCFTLKSYLSRRQSAISPPSTDDEDDEAPARIFRRPLFRRSRRMLRRHLQCVLRQLCVFLESETEDLAGEDSADFGGTISCTCSWPGGSCNGRLQSSSRLNLQLQFDGRSPVRSSPPVVFRRQENGDDKDMDDDIFHTPPSSWTASSSSSAGSSEAHTPDEGLEIFMQGRAPTKVDLDVLRALENVSVDPILYPCLYRWKQLVSSFPDATRSKWQTPCSTRQRPQFPMDTTFSSSPASPWDSPLGGSRRLHGINAELANLDSSFSELSKEGQF